MKKVLKMSLMLLVLFWARGVFAMEISSSAFKNGGDIPAKYTCAGEDISVPLSFSGVPAGTKSFAIICEDPDAQFSEWVHWIIFNIPGGMRVLPENFSKNPSLGVVQGKNDFGNNFYGGPCPPQGKPHRYIFRVYALNVVLELDEKTVKKDVLTAIEGHILDENKLTGMYKR